MSAAEMREAAARLCDHQVAAWKVRLEEARTHSEANECEAACDTAKELAGRIRRLPPPDEEGMVERVKEALHAAALEETKRWLATGKDINMTNVARAAIRAINGGEP